LVTTSSRPAQCSAKYSRPALRRSITAGRPAAAAEAGRRATCAEKGDEGKRGRAGVGVIRVWVCAVWVCVWVCVV
jgi:hypothetical protein